MQKSRRKPVQFHGTAREDLRKFPEIIRKEMGHQIQLVQFGNDPNNYKNMPKIGLGAREIRIRGGDSTFRVVYVAKFDEAIHILHAFQKNTTKTEKCDIDLARKRYNDMIKGRKK